MISNRQLHPREYRIWKGMRARVSAPCNRNMGNYQKFGIKVCERWDSFDNFISDMGLCPEGYSIDRIDTTGNYCPENCRWTDQTTQCKNRGYFTPLFELNGERKILKDWAKEFNINYTTLRHRIFKLHLTLEEAINYHDPRKKY